MVRITKVVITGGPCAGKTSALGSLRKTFESQGYKVITLPEPATELIGNGITPWECSTSEEYQRCQMEMQLTRERVYERAARGMAYEHILMLFDRGMLDNKCYMTEDEFERVVADLHTTEAELCGNYDAVFHLESSAKRARESYSLETNATRIETPEEAVRLDDRSIEAWSVHPNLYIIHSTPDFDLKLRQLNEGVARVLAATKV